MKFTRKLLASTVIATALALSACGSDSDPLDVSGNDTGEDVGADTGTDTDGDTGGDTDADTGTDTDGDTGGDTDGDTGGDTDGDNGGDTDSDTGGDTDGDTGADTDGDTGTDTGGDADAETGPSASSRAVVSSISADFSSAVVDLIGVEEPFEVEGNLHPGVSDTIVRAYEDRYFVIRRFMSDSIAAYSTADTSTPLYEVSTNSDDEESSSNPHDLVFLSAEKAYLLRYGSPLVWIVNPSAADPSQFKIGEIDLSAYDADGVPEATRGVVVGDKLYIVMQRLEGFAPTQTGYVAVIDTATDTEIDTGTGDGLPGIELPVFNPGDVSVDESSDTLFISAFGDFGSGDGSREPALTGGVVVLDTTDYSATQLIDDNDGTGRINNVEVANATAGYIVSSAGFGASSLDRFNPVTGRIDALGVAGLSGVDIRDIAMGPAGNLWVAVADPESPRMVVVNPADGSTVAAAIATSQNPSSIAFTE